MQAKSWSKAQCNCARGRASGNPKQPRQSNPDATGRENAITCFTPNTAITTLNGKKNVSDLMVGDRALTRDRGFQPIRWIGRRHLRAQDIAGDAPILIRADALGPGMPERDMVISPRHRVLTANRTILDCLGTSEALIEAAALVGQPGISRIAPQKLTYIHVLFDQHEVIHTDNIWSESFHLCPAVATALLRQQHREILSIFPEIETSVGPELQRLARPCLSSQEVLELHA